MNWLRAQFKAIFDKVRDEGVVGLLHLGIRAYGGGAAVLGLLAGSMWWLWSRIAAAFWLLEGSIATYFVFTFVVGLAVGFFAGDRRDRRIREADAERRAADAQAVKAEQEAKRAKFERDTLRGLVAEAEELQRLMTAALEDVRRFHTYFDVETNSKMDVLLRKLEKIGVTRPNTSELELNACVRCWNLFLQSATPYFAAGDVEGVKDQIDVTNQVADRHRR